MNILLVDDHAVVREGYKTLITALIPDTSVFEAECGKTTFEQLADNQFDLIILDINLALESGLILAKQILQQYPDAKIIFFSMFEDGAILRRASETGAMGYISKQSDPQTLISAIEQVQKGQKYIQQEIAIKLAKQLLNEQIDIEARLTNREFQIFIAFAMKKNRHEIANELGVSTKTISNTLTTIKRKLDVDANDFASLAVQHGYIGAPAQNPPS